MSMSTRSPWKQFFTHPDWQTTHPYIIDLTKLDASKLQRTYINRISEIARRLRAKHGVRKSAVVAPNDMEFGIIRMVMVYAEDETIPANVFRTLEEAAAWVSEDDPG